MFKVVKYVCVCAVWFDFVKPAWGAPTDLVMETECVMATGLAGGTESAAATTVTKGSPA